jgi:mercuric ion transport protein
MKDHALIATGAVGVVVAAICCATPVLALMLAALGLAVWATKADFVVIPLLLISLGLVGFGIFRRRAKLRRPGNIDRTVD